MVIAASTQFTNEEGLFELTLINAEHKQKRFDDVILEGLKRGIPPEIITRLRVVWEVTKTISGEVVNIGKLIIQQIFDFLTNNPKISIGLAIGAAVSVLIAGIPFLGAILEPLSTILVTLYGAGVGASLQVGDTSGSPFSAAIELASKFFELLKNIFSAILQNYA